MGLFTRSRSATPQTPDAGDVASTCASDNCPAPSQSLAHTVERAEQHLRSSLEFLDQTSVSGTRNNKNSNNSHIHRNDGASLVSDDPSHRLADLQRRLRQAEREFGRSFSKTKGRGQQPSGVYNDAAAAATTGDSNSNSNNTSNNGSFSYDEEEAEGGTNDSTLESYTSFPYRSHQQDQQQSHCVAHGDYGGISTAGNTHYSSPLFYRESPEQHKRRQQQQFQIVDMFQNPGIGGSDNTSLVLMEEASTILQDSLVSETDGPPAMVPAVTTDSPQSNEQHSIALGNKQKQTTTTGGWLSSIWGGNRTNTPNGHAKNSINSPHIVSPPSHVVSPPSADATSFSLSTAAQDATMDSGHPVLLLQQAEQELQHHLHFVMEVSDDEDDDDGQKNGADSEAPSSMVDNASGLETLQRDLARVEAGFALLPTSNGTNNNNKGNSNSGDPSLPSIWKEAPALPLPPPPPRIMTMPEQDAGSLMGEDVSVLTSDSALASYTGPLFGRRFIRGRSSPYYRKHPRVWIEKADSLDAVEDGTGTPGHEGNRRRRRGPAVVIQNPPVAIVASAAEQLPPAPPRKVSSWGSLKRPPLAGVSTRDGNSNSTPEEKKVDDEAAAFRIVGVASRQIQRQEQQQSKGPALAAHAAVLVTPPASLGKKKRSNVTYFQPDSGKKASAGRFFPHDKKRSFGGGKALFLTHDEQQQHQEQRQQIYSASNSSMTYKVGETSRGALCNDTPGIANDYCAKKATVSQSTPSKQQQLRTPSEDGPSVVMQQEQSWQRGADPPGDMALASAQQPSPVALPNANLLAAVRATQEFGGLPQPQESSFETMEEAASLSTIESLEPIGTGGLKNGGGGLFGWMTGSGGGSGKKNSQEEQGTPQLGIRPRYEGRSGAADAKASVEALQQQHHQERPVSTEKEPRKLKTKSPSSRATTPAEALCDCKTDNDPGKSMCQEKQNIEPLEPAAAMVPKTASGGGGLFGWMTANNGSGNKHSPQEKDYALKLRDIKLCEERTYEHESKADATELHQHSPVSTAVSREERIVPRQQQQVPTEVALKGQTSEHAKKPTAAEPHQHQPGPTENQNEAPGSLIPRAATQAEALSEPKTSNSDNHEDQENQSVAGPAVNMMQPLLAALAFFTGESGLFVDQPPKTSCSSGPNQPHESGENDNEEEEELSLTNDSGNEDRQVQGDASPCAKINFVGATSAAAVRTPATANQMDRSTTATPSEKSAQPTSEASCCECLRF